MNVLEKILEEIDKKADYYETDEQGREHVRMVDMIDVEEIIRSNMNHSGDDTEMGDWITVEEGLPEDDRYILLSFENFSLPLVGRYEENEKGGAFYIGDCDEEDTCASNDLFVNAWKPLPEPYRPKEKNNE